MGKVYPFLSKLADPRPLTPNRRIEPDEAITQRVYMKRPIVRRRVDWNGVAVGLAVFVSAMAIGLAASLCVCRLLGYV